MKIYVASSWRNIHQQGVVSLLRELGHDVYDFRNPRPGNHGFSWREIDPDWANWSPGKFRKGLTHAVSIDGFNSDRFAMEEADACMLVLPCGRSAHLEAGVFVGWKKPLTVYVPERIEPELMYRFAQEICVTRDELQRAFAPS